MTYYIHGPVAFSDLTKRLEGYLDIKGDSMTLWFEDADVIVDEMPSWISNFPTVAFMRSTLSLRNSVFGDTKNLDYAVKNYDPIFYESFPNLVSLSVTAKDLRDLSFLFSLPRLERVSIKTAESDRNTLSMMFRQFHKFVTTTKNAWEGFVDFRTPYPYPYANPDSSTDVFTYYAEPPLWYDGPDISGVPAWINDNKVRLRKGPFLDSPVLKLLNTGDYVLIKGKAGEGPHAAPWNSEKSFRNEEDAWIKVRLPDRTDGYVHNPYLTLKNPKYFPFQREVESGR